MRTKAAAAAAATAALVLASCASSPPRHHASSTTNLAGAAGAVHAIANGQVLRLGYPEDFTSAPALAALQLGLYQQDMDGVAVQPQGYISDLDEVNALEHGQLDAAYLDPIAAINAWQFSSPGYLRVIAGATTGTTELIARNNITSPAQLRGTTVEAPADSSEAAALDAWLARNHLTSTVHLNGSPLTTIGILQQFTTGIVSAAWEPAPLAQQLIAAGGHELTSQRNTTTGVLVITQRFLTANPAAVRNLLKTQIQACAQSTTQPAATQTAEAQTLASQTGTQLAAPVLAAAFTDVTCTTNPQANSILTQTKQAASAAITKPVTNLASLFDLRPLNALLIAARAHPVSP